MMLKRAQLRQVEGGLWEVFVDDKGYGYLPVKMTSKEAIGVLEWAKRFEHLAFDEGKKLGTDATVHASSQRLNELTLHNKALKSENTRLAETIESLLNNGE